MAKTIKEIQANAQADMMEAIGIDKKICNDVIAAAKSEFAVTLEDDTFNAAKLDFNLKLEEILSEMIAHGSSEASVALKVKIKLAKDYVSVYANSEGSVEVMRPTFEHEVVGTIQYQTKVNGMVGGEGYKLEYDRIDKKYFMRKVGSPQMNLFDRSTPEPETEAAGA